MIVKRVGMYLAVLLAAVLALGLAEGAFGGAEAFAAEEEEAENTLRPAGVYESETVSEFRACVHRDSYLLQEDSYEATETEGGLRHYKCSVCGAEYSYETAPLVYMEDVNEGNIGAFNPLLPDWDFLPDPRPHVYWSRPDQEWRVYVYGAHDINGTSGGGPEYPLWSAPVYDLSDWRNEGLILEIPEAKLVATDCGYDVTTDSYYLLADFANPVNRIDMLVSDNPCGKWDAGDVVASVPLRYAYNPSIYAEDGVLYLSGAAYKGCAEEMGRQDILDAMDADNYKVKHILAVHQLKGDLENGFTVEKTVFPATEEQIYLPVYEGVSMTGWVEELSAYVVIYASDGYNEKEERFYSTMAYAYTDDLMSESWHYGDNGVDGDILDYPGDLGMSGNKGNAIHDGSGRFARSLESGEIEFTGFPVLTYDSNQGGIARINGKWYLFGQRHIEASGCNRQMVAEQLEVSVNEDGTPLIQATEVTSSGVADYLDAYTAQKAESVSCLLSDIHTPAKALKEIEPQMPYITANRDPEAVHASYITNLHSGAVAGFKYFGFGGEDEAEDAGAGRISLLVAVPEGLGDACADVYLDAPEEAAGGRYIGTVSLAADAASEDETLVETGADGTQWYWVHGDLEETVTGVHAVYLIFRSDDSEWTGSMDELYFE